MKKTVDLFKKIVKQSLMPLSDQTVSEWADSYRMISGEAAAEPGRWRTDRAPYQKAIMDAFTEPGITRVVAKTASQVGKSDIMNNVIGRFAHHENNSVWSLVRMTHENGSPWEKTYVDYEKRVIDKQLIREAFANDVN